MMEISARIFVFTIALASVNSCPSSMHGAKRQAKALTNEKELAKFFGEECEDLQIAADAAGLDLQSTVDAVLGDMKWFEHVRTKDCVSNTEFDSANCWKTAVYFELNIASILLVPVQSCITAWENKPDLEGARKRRDVLASDQKKDFTPDQERFITCLDGILKSERNPYGRSYNARSITCFLRDHYTYCPTIPDIRPLISPNKCFRAAKRYVEKNCDASSNPQQQNDLRRVFEKEVENRGTLRDAVDRCISELPAGRKKRDAL